MSKKEPGKLTRVNYLRLHQAKDLAEVLRADGLGLQEHLVLMAIASHVSTKDNRPVSVKNTSFLSYATISEETFLKRTAITNAVRNLTGSEIAHVDEKKKPTGEVTPGRKSNNFTGEPYLRKTKTNIQDTDCLRFHINVELFDSMGTWKNKQTTSAPEVAPYTGSFAADPADDTDFLDVDAPEAPRKFLAVVDNDPANQLTQQYWNALDKNSKWIRSGEAWQSAFSTALERNTFGELTHAIEWGFSDPTWGKILRGAKNGQDKVPYFLTKYFDDIMRRSQESLKSSTRTAAPTAAHTTTPMTTEELDQLLNG
jgi:hypothetical protein